MRPIIAIAFLVLCPVAFGATIHVPADYPKIQQAIDAAVNGDTVLVAKGTYIENIDFTGKAIIVQSDQGPLVTTIDGSNPVNPDYGSTVSFSSGEGPDSLLVGFTVQKGTGTKVPVGHGHNYHFGGGIICINQSSPKFINNIITLNTEVFSGGGMYIEDSDPTLIDCTFSHNEAQAYYVYGYGGGGIYILNSNPRIRNCDFNNNTSNWDGGGICNVGGNPELINCSFTQNNHIYAGGGIYTENGSPTLTNCSFYRQTYGSCGSGVNNHGGNVVLTDCLFVENEAFTAGGGLQCYDGGDATLNRCTFINNYAQGGGGAVDVSFNGSSLTMNHCSIIGCTAWYGAGLCTGHAGTIVNLNGCTFIGNNATKAGGAIDCYSSDMTIVNCSFIENSAVETGGAIRNWGPVSPKLINCSFGGNTGRPGGAIYNENGSSPVLVNCILWGDEPDEISNAADSDAFITYSCVMGGYPGVGNIDSDPLFADPFAYDGHLCFNSPCRGSGDNSVPGLPEFDFEGDPRIFQGTVDMGADEFHTHLYYTGDATPGGEIEGKLVGLPGMNPTGLWFGLGGVLDPPVQTQYGLWHLNPPWIQVWLMQPIPTSGILVVPATIPSYPAPYDIPMQGLVGLNSESLTNLCVLKVR